MQKFFFISIIFVFLTSCIPDKYKGLEAGIYAEIQTNKGNILLELHTEYVPKTVANFIEERDGRPSNAKNIFLTNGASPGIQMVLQSVIRSENDCVTFLIT